MVFLRKSKKPKRKPPKEPKVQENDENKTNIKSVTLQKLKEIAHDTMPQGWYMAVDATSGNPYFWNEDVNHGAPTWDHPKFVAIPTEWLQKKIRNN